MSLKLNWKGNSGDCMNWNFSRVHGPNFKSKLIFKKFRNFLNLTLTSMVLTCYLT